MEILYLEGRCVNNKVRLTYGIREEGMDEEKYQKFMRERGLKEEKRGVLYQEFPRQEDFKDNWI